MGSSLEELHTLRCSTIKDEILELGMVAHLGLRSWRPASVTQEDCLSNNKKDNNIPKTAAKAWVWKAGPYLSYQVPSKVAEALELDVLSCQVHQI